MPTGCAGAELALRAPLPLLWGHTSGPSPRVFAQETGKKRPHASNGRLAHYSGERTEAKFIYVNTHTFLSTNLWNLAPETFALLHIRYKITRDSFDSCTLTLEQKLRDGALHI